MKTIAIIPARGNSKRLAGKNLLLLGDIPLVVHSILYAKANLNIIDEVYVTTDCEKIKVIALKYGAKVIERPEEISGDFEPTVSALKHVLMNIEQVENVVLLQPTNPLRHEKLLLEAFNTFESKCSESLFTVTRNYQKFGKIIDNVFVPFNYKIGQRSQDLAPLYFENGLLYIIKASLVLNNIIISNNATPFEINDNFANVDIDTIEDLNYARYLYDAHNKLNNGL